MLPFVRQFSHLISRSEQCRLQRGHIPERDAALPPARVMTLNIENSDTTANNSPMHNPIGGSLEKSCFELFEVFF